MRHTLAMSALGLVAAALASEAAGEVTRLGAAAAQSVAAGQRLEAAGQVIRAGLLRLGAGMLEDLLAIDAGYAGPRLTPPGMGLRALAPGVEVLALGRGQDVDGAAKRGEG